MSSRTIVITLLGLFVTLSYKVLAQETILQCPTELQTPLLVLSPGQQSSILRLAIPPYGLCTLIRITTDVDTGRPHLTPAGRTFDGHPWESVQPLRLPFSCENYAATFATQCCQVSIPAVESNEGYYLVSYQHSLSRSQEISRLLMQTTFGPTMSEIQWLESEDISAEEFIQQQMDVEPTLHRAYYRRNIQARVYESYSAGKPRHPCEKYSRWRRFAFSAEDRNKRLTVSEQGPPYVLSVDGFVRTEVWELNPLGSSSDDVLIPGYDGMICGKGASEDAVGGGGFRITDNKARCRASGLPNPPIQLGEDTLSAHMIDIISLDEKKLEVVNEERTGRDELINIADKIYHAGCAAVPVEGRTKPTFAKMKDGSWYMHDPFLELDDNTPEDPLQEAGRWGSVPGVLCPSAPRTAIFEQDCFRSTAESSCSANGDSGPGSIVCPSPGEVANDPLGDTLFDMARDRIADGTGNRRDDFEYQRWGLWMKIALSAEDQLRQKMAWALYNTIPLEGDLNDLETESHVTFFDSFVRNAFGNYRDLIREVIYSPQMAKMLSYEANKSTDYVYRTKGRFIHPDENMARETLQLFTIGLYRLNLDGSHVLDEDGNSVQTYTSDDIIEFSRAWTGFAFQDPRGNIEAVGKNMVDPLRLKHYRDDYPKMDLYGGYLGDDLPLCNEAPEKLFLKKGATYRLLGKTSVDNLYSFDRRWLDNGGDHLDIQPSEDLYRVLCNAQNDEGGCNHKIQVVLDKDIVLSPSSNLNRMDTVRLIKIDDAYYEYTASTCVELSFYNNAQKISYGPQADFSRCANPESSAAGGACCVDKPNKLHSAFPTCEFAGERISFVSLVDRCAANDGKTLVPCDFQKISRNDCGVCCNVRLHSWTPAECSILAKVNDEGKISIVHEPYEAKAVDMKYGIKSRNYFRVAWGDKDFPSVSNQCGQGVCIMLDSSTCLCNTVEVTRPLITNFVDIQQIKLDDLRDMLKIGSFDPATYGGKYMEPITVYTQGLDEIFLWKPSFGPLEDTIIALPDRNGPKYFRNKESSVHILDAQAQPRYHFRNPPSFGSDYRDAIHETEALLDHLFYHSNTAPFISHRLIQRFGTSNPSPGYIERVATAFSNGAFVSGGIEFGSKQYGDLKATVAAILLDRETRSTVLDADPTSGSIREPLLKLVHMMRSMAFKPDMKNGGKLVLLEMDELIGEMPYGHPSVFSYFLSDFKAPGPIASAGLVAPEATLLTQPNVVGLIKGLWSLIKYGLNGCDGGFGSALTVSSCLELVEGNYDASEGYLSYIPMSNDPAKIVDELDLLLTAGRLGVEERELISSSLASQQEDVLLGSDKGHLVRLAQQLISAAPEFHVTNLIGQGLQTGPDRAITTPTIRRRIQEMNVAPVDQSAPIDSAQREYKAIVYLFLVGGADSYNMFVPHSGCKEKDLYEEYTDVRGVLSLEKDELIPIDVGEEQPCSVFGLHPSLPTLATMFNEGDAAIIANAGILHEPSNKTNYNANHAQTRLFAHDAQQRETKLMNPAGDVFTTGMLGRATDVLAERGYATSSVALDNGADVLTGQPFKSKGISYLNARDPTKFNENPSAPTMKDTIYNLNNSTSLGSGMYGCTWSGVLLKAMDDNDFFFDILSRDQESSAHEDNPIPSTALGAKLDVVAKLIKARKERKIDRDVFYVTLPGFDHHTDMLTRLASKYDEMNAALEGFVSNIKAEGIWDNVVLTTSSDFGRTLTPNANFGSDHGWAGAHLVAGGSVRGGQVIGKYPEDLTTKSDLFLDRGRVIPTTALETYWNGILDWFGVEEARNLNAVLPNRGQASMLLTKDDMFAGDDVAKEGREVEV